MSTPTTAISQRGYVPLFLQKALCTTKSLMAEKSAYRFLLVNPALLLVLVSFCFPFLIESQAAWAVSAHVAHSTSTNLQHSVSISRSQDKAKPPKGKKPKKQNNKKTNKQKAKKSKSLSFPCQAATNKVNGRTQPSASITKDWLTGSRGSSYVGHLMSTYAADTYQMPAINSLFGYMVVLSFSLITPSILLSGYQIMLGASVFRYAGALEGLSRVLLGGLAIAVSFTLVQMLISLENSIAAGIVLLHGEHPYPIIKVSGTLVPYVLPKQPRISYAGIVVPMTRWGCAMNGLMGVFSGPFVQNTLASIIPLLSRFSHLTDNITTMQDLIERVGQMILTVLSMLLWLQVFGRILFLNYYILLAPVAFSCWALPGGVGQNVVHLWCKGFFTVLFVQVVQLFILTTLPLLLPAMPQIPSNNADFIQGFLVEFSPILTLGITVMAPRLVGVSIDKALSTAGLMAEGTVVAVGTAASRTM